MGQIPLYESGKLVFLKAITPIHAGTGRTYGEAVDLPIQRDEFGIPVIWGSSLKGAIRAQKESSLTDIRDSNVKNSRKIILNAIFGPDESGREIETASSVSILDARLLIIPARSLRGPYVYVTSNHLLQYYLNYVRILLSCTKHKNAILASIEQNLTKLTEVVKDIPEEKAIVFSKNILIEVNNKQNAVVNEQFFEAEIRNDLKDLTKSCMVLNGNLLSEDDISKLVIVSDYVINDIIRTSLQVITRVRLDYERKTVKAGGLWSEEYLPMNTVLVSAILFSRPRILRLCSEQSSGSDERIRERCKVLVEYSDLNKVWSDIIDPGTYLILGGHETIGKGMVKVITL